MTNRCRECRGRIDARTLRAGGELCFDCATNSTRTIITVYRRDIPIARAEWSARYEATAAGLRTVLHRLERYTDPIYVWVVTTMTT